MFYISKNLCIFRTVLKSKMEKYTKRDPHTRNTILIKNLMGIKDATHRDCMKTIRC